MKVRRKNPPSPFRRYPNTSRADPTRTKSLRGRFAADLFRRLEKIRRAVLHLVADEDAFGLKPISHDPFTLSTTLLNEGKVYTENTRWRLATNPEKVKAFKEWLEKQTKITLLGTPEEELWGKYIQEGFRKGAARALNDALRGERLRGKRDELQRLEGTKDQILRQLFNKAVVVERLRLLTGRVYNELEGLAADLQTTLIRTLADGLMQGLTPAKLALALSKEVGLSKVRALRVANHEIVKTHAEGQLDALEELGHTLTGVEAEWVTSGENVCPKCSSMAGKILKIEDARGLLPLHPHCKCSFRPVKTDTKGRILRKVPARKLQEQVANEDTPADSLLKSLTHDESIPIMTVLTPQPFLPASLMDRNLLLFSRLLSEIS